MKNPFHVGAVKLHNYVVKESDIARFETGEVHAVFSTFALTREAEWSGRLFVLDMKESDEEGIGTFISVEHLHPAAIGAHIVFKAHLTQVNKNEICNNFEAFWGEICIAKGSQKQKILKKTKLQELMKRINE